MDCFQIFIKSHGVYSMIDSIAHPSRLHLLYEIIPVAFLIEKAGGKTSDQKSSVLDVEIKSYDQRISFICGSNNDVDYIVNKLAEPASE